MNSFNFEPPSTEFTLTLNELNVFSLVDQPDGAACTPAPYGCELVLRP